MRTHSLGLLALVALLALTSRTSDAQHLRRTDTNAQDDLASRGLAADQLCAAKRTGIAAQLHAHLATECRLDASRHAVGASEGAVGAEAMVVAHWPALAGALHLVADGGWRAIRPRATCSRCRTVPNLARVTRRSTCSSWFPSFARSRGSHATDGQQRQDDRRLAKLTTRRRLGEAGVQRGRLNGPVGRQLRDERECVRVDHRSPSCPGSWTCSAMPGASLAVSPRR